MKIPPCLVGFFICKMNYIFDKMHDIYCKMNNIDYNGIKQGGMNVNFFKRPKKRVDERIENVRNQIYKEIYMIISVHLLREFLFKSPSIRCWS